MSKYIPVTDEEIYIAAHKDIKAVLESMGETVKPSGTEWLWERHDSLKFRGHVWYQHSTNEKGTTIDLLCQFFNMSFPDAVITLLNGNVQVNCAFTKKEIKNASKKNAKKKKLIPPPRNENNKRAFAYLTQTRKIDNQVVNFFIRKGILYESAHTHNVVFAGCDKYGVIRHCTQKGTLTEHPFTGEVFGSNKAYSFCHIGKSDTMFIFEAAIDMLSYITLFMLDREWYKDTFVAINGLSRLAIDRVLQDYPYIKNLVFCYDNDKDGKDFNGNPKNHGQIAAHKHSVFYQKKGYQVKIDTPELKDWNKVVEEQNK